jgi:predicted membrane protein
MRVFWISLVIICIFIIFSIYYTYILEKSSGNIVTSIEDIEKKIDKNDWDGVQKDLDILRNKWEGMIKPWSSFIEHEELDNIQVSILKVDEYISMNNEVLTRSELSVLKYLVRHIYLKEKLELGNIF